MSDYYIKYLKYKNKYLQLKNQIGGDYIDVSVNGHEFQVPTSLTDSSGSFDLFTDPVMTIDGQTYERTTIEQWFRHGHNTSPATREILEELTLIPNLTLKNVIKEIITKELTSNDRNYAYIDVTRNKITITIKLPSSFLNKNIIDYVNYGEECFYDFYNDPVVASDGYTYERKYIERWLNIFNISPTTGKEINKKLLKNFALINAINEIIEKEFSDYDSKFTLVTKRQKKCIVHPLDNFFYTKKIEIFNLLRSVPDNKKIDILINLSPYDLVNTYLEYIYVYNFNWPHDKSLMLTIKNFMEQNHSDFFIYAINKYNIEKAKELAFYQQQELEEEFLLNESPEYDTKQRNLQKRQNLGK